MFIIKYKKIFVSISAVLVLLSVLAVGVSGLKWGIDFKGGSIIEVEYNGTRPSHDEVTSIVKNSGVESEIVVAAKKDACLHGWNRSDHSSSNRVHNGIDGDAGNLAISHPEINIAKIFGEVAERLKAAGC